MLMKQENKNCFQIQFPKSIIWVCVAVYALCSVGIGLSVWRIARFGVGSFHEALKYPFLLLVCVLCIVIVTSVLIKSEYIVEDPFLISKFGLVKSKFPIKEITSMVFDKDQNKLSLYFQEQFIVLSVSPIWSEDLTRALLKVNPDIDYSFTLSEPPETKQ